MSWTQGQLHQVRFLLVPGVLKKKKNWIEPWQAMVFWTLIEGQSRGQPRQQHPRFLLVAGEAKLLFIRKSWRSKRRSSQKMLEHLHVEDNILRLMHPKHRQKYLYDNVCPAYISRFLMMNKNQLTIPNIISQITKCKLGNTKNYFTQIADIIINQIAICWSKHYINYSECSILYSIKNSLCIINFSLKF